MAKLKPILLLRRQEDISRGVLYNNFPRAGEHNQIIERLNSITDEDGILTGGSVVNDNLVLENTNNTTTSIAIYGVNVITTSTSVDRACKLPAAKTGRSTVFINNSTLPILVFPSAVGGEINGVVNGFASIPNDGRAYTFYCIENPLPGAWTWSAPATTQYDSGEIICDTTAGGGSASNFNVSVSTNYAVPYLGAGSPSTGWVFACQTRPLLDTPLPNLLPYSAGDTGGISGTALSAGIMNITKIKIYTNAHVGGSGIYAGMAVASGFSVYDSSISPGNFITNGPSTAGSGPNTSGETWLQVPGATLAPNTLSANIGDPGTDYIILDVSNSWAALSNFINFGPPQYIGPNGANVGEFLWYMGAWQFFIQPNVNFTDFKYQFIFEYN
jgi:hypothetical protein